MDASARAKLSETPYLPQTQVFEGIFRDPW